jgi:dTDP-4-dehydrorhamnose 3,5-epimerase
MRVRPLGLDGVFEITPRKFGDDRGFFSETYNVKALVEAGIDLNFVQDNHSYSAAKGVVRGLHYQLPPFAQDKLVRVTRGAILDVAVDIRRSSSTFGEWVSLEVSAEKWNQILVPKGFAHGFITLVENTDVTYKVTDYYYPEHDRSIRFDDPAIGVEWPIPATGVQLSSKDEKGPLLANADVFD